MHTISSAPAPWSVRNASTNAPGAGAAVGERVGHFEFEALRGVGLSARDARGEDDAGEPRVAAVELDEFGVAAFGFSSFEFLHALFQLAKQQGEIDR